MYTKQPQVHPKTPHHDFLVWTWTWAKWTTVWAIWTQTGQNVWKLGKTFLEVGKKFIHTHPLSGIAGLFGSLLLFLSSLVSRRACTLASVPGPLLSRSGRRPVAARQVGPVCCVERDHWGCDPTRSPARPTCQSVDNTLRTGVLGSAYT